MSDNHRLPSDGRDRSRLWWRVGAAAGLVVALVAVLVATLTVIRHEKDDTPLAGPASPAAGTPRPSGGATVSGGPQPPKDGAYVGAVVQSDDFTAPGRIAAITDWEARMGRQMDLVHTYHTWDDPFPDQMDKWAVSTDHALVLSWGGTDTRVIQTGRYDDLIRQRAQDLKKWDAPVLLQWRWEMDRPNLQAQIWGPTDYVNAWRHIRAIFAEEKVTNVSWVWCPTAEGFTDGRAQNYYPGDAEVDWVCADVYPGEDDDSFATRSKDFLNWAKEHPKPILIGEYGAYEGFPEGQASWLRQAAQVAKDNPSIKGLIYFNRDDENKRPRTQLQLRGDGAVAAYREFIADPYFNPRSVPVKR